MKMNKIIKFCMMIIIVLCGIFGVENLVQANETFVLTEENCKYVYVQENMIIDVNGQHVYEMEVMSGDAVIIDSVGDGVIENIKVRSGSNLTMNAGMVKGGQVDVYGTFTMNSGKLEDAAIALFGTFIMNGGSINVEERNAIWLFGNNTKTVINNGVINAKGSAVIAFVYSWSTSAVREGRVNDITINGGTLKGDYIIQAYDNGDKNGNRPEKPYGRFDYFSEKNTFNVNVNGGKLSVYKSENVNELYQEINLGDHINGSITGGEFDIPVSIENRNINITNARFNKGLKIYNLKDSSKNTISVTMKNCNVKDKLRIDSESLKKINCTLDGGIYNEVRISCENKNASVIIKGGKFDEEIGIDAGNLTINNGVFKKRADFNVESVKINNGNFESVEIDADSVKINGGKFYCKKNTALHIRVKKIKKVKFNGGSFKTGKATDSAIYIEYSDKKKAKVNYKKVKNILKKGYGFGKGYVATEDSRYGIGKFTIKTIRVYGNAKVKKGKISWAVEFYTSKKEVTPYSNGKKIAVLILTKTKGVKTGSKYGKLPKAKKRKGYVFKGWQTETGRKVTAKTKHKLKNSIKLYAFYEKK